MCTGFTINHAISASKLRREDAPRPYNYSYISVNEKEKFNINNSNNTIARNKRISEFYEDLQYAPLSLIPINQKKYDSTQRPIEVTTPEKIKLTKHIFPNNHRVEPHLVDYKSGRNGSPLTVISGHNIAIQSEVNLEDSRTTTSEPLSNFFKEHDGMRISKVSS